MKKPASKFGMIATMLFYTLGLVPYSANSQTSDFGIYKLNSSQGWDQIPGGGIRIAVDQSGNPWIVNSQKDIYQYVNKTFIKLPGQANDIAIGGGRVWVIGNDNVGTGGDHGVFQWNGSGWDKVPGGGTSIAVDANGLPWITNSVKDIYQFTSSNQFVKQSGQGNDISIGGDNTVCVIGNKQPIEDTYSSHGMYLGDLNLGKTVTIDREIDCHVYEEWDILLQPNVSLIGDRPFDVYFEVNRLGVYSIDNVEHATKTEFKMVGVTRYAYVWSKSETLPVHWARVGISVRKPNLPLHLKQRHGIYYYNVSRDFQYFLDK